MEQPSDQQTQRLRALIRVDTNYLLRYLIADNEEMANIAESLISTSKVFVANEILAEVVYVLLGVYDISKAEIVPMLKSLVMFENIIVTDKQILIKALDIFEKKSLDFVDALLCAYATKDTIKTFDKKLQKCVENHR